MPAIIPEKGPGEGKEREKYFLTGQETPGKIFLSDILNREKLGSKSWLYWYLCHSLAVLPPDNDKQKGLSQRSLDGKLPRLFLGKLVPKTGLFQKIFKLIKILPNINLKWWNFVILML